VPFGTGPQSLTTAVRNRILPYIEDEKLYVTKAVYPNSQ